jgi:hypothetical protein
MNGAVFLNVSNPLRLFPLTVVAYRRRKFFPAEVQFEE